MALFVLLKFAVASGALYLSKEMGLWDLDRSEPIHNNNLSIEIKRIFFDKEEKKKPECEPNWYCELKNALGGTFQTLQKIPGHWQKFGQIVQANIKSLFCSDDDD